MKALSFNSNTMGLGLLVLLVFSLKTALGGTIVTSLPGYGDLNFTLETGYVGVGKNEEVQLFYYFAESQSSPEQDPLLLWINGGPGCSSLAAFLFGSGPLSIDTINYSGGLPTLFPNPSSWTQGLNVIFLDAPVYTGFSYLNSSESYNLGDYSFVNQTYEFILKWLNEHQRFSKHQLYLSGEGYSGTPVVLVIDRILKGNEIAPETAINIKGYVLGNPSTDKIIDWNARTTIMYRLGLIPQALYEAAYIACDNGNFTTDNPNDACTNYINEINQIVSNIKRTNTLQPSCGNPFKVTLKEQTDADSTRRYLKEKSRYFLDLPADAQEKQCTEYLQDVTETWVNDKDVQKALHVKATNWTYCSNADYTIEVTSVVDYHRNFTRTDLQGLIFSGDHDTGVPYIGTLEWMQTLNVTSVESWSPWSVDEETAGFTMRFTNNGRFNLTYATVVGAGHFAGQDKPRECFEMVQRWVVNRTLS